MIDRQKKLAVQALCCAGFPLVAIARIGGAVSPHPLLGLLAAMVAGMELGLLAVHPRGFWHAVSLPWSARLGLAVLVPLTWASLAWIAWWCRALWPIARPRRKSHWWGYAVQIAVAAAGAGISALFVASWVFFWRAGVFLDLEALRHDVIGMQHQGREIMPHVNGLARGGVHFTNAYSQSTHSDYADPCIVSSLYPLRTRGHHYYSRSDPWPKVLIYDVLKQHGYATAIISSQNEGWGRMDQFLASPHLDLFFDSRDYDGETLVCDRDPGFVRFVKGARVAGKLDDRITIRKVIEWIGEQQAADVPFFVSVNLQTSHFPSEIPGGRTGPFQPATMDFPASFVSYPRDKVPVVRNAYYNALHYIDQQIGRLVSFLDEAGLREETLLLIAGDNGEAFYENGHPTHAGPPFEPAIRVGLLMHCPAVLAPKRESYLVQLIDVAPTALALLGIAPHPCFQGIDVLAADRPADEARVVLVHCESALSGSDAAVNGTGWKYVEDRRSGQRRLHQLDTDPGEERDLVDTYPEVARVLQGVMHQWRQRQLLYYQTPAYYGWYWPPRTPMVSAEDVKRLISFRVLEEEACFGVDGSR